jgi:hypothetical protein
LIDFARTLPNGSIDLRARNVLATADNRLRLYTLDLAASKRHRPRHRATEPAIAPEIAFQSPRFATERRTVEMAELMCNYEPCELPFEICCRSPRDARAVASDHETRNRSTANRIARRDPSARLSVEDMIGAEEPSDLRIRNQSMARRYCVGGELMTRAVINHPTCGIEGYRRDPKCPTFLANLTYAVTGDNGHAVTAQLGDPAYSTPEEVWPARYFG